MGYKNVLKYLLQGKYIHIAFYVWRHDSDTILNALLVTSHYVLRVERCNLNIFIHLHVQYFHNKQRKGWNHLLTFKSGERDISSFKHFDTVYKISGHPTTHQPTPA